MNSTILACLTFGIQPDGCLVGNCTDGERAKNQPATQVDRCIDLTIFECGSLALLGSHLAHSASIEYEILLCWILFVKEQQQVKFTQLPRTKHRQDLWKRRSAAARSSSIIIMQSVIENIKSRNSEEAKGTPSLRLALYPTIAPLLSIVIGGIAIHLEHPIASWCPAPSKP